MLKVLYAAAEVQPFAKVGGLGDVAQSLPKALKKEGADVRVVMPMHGKVWENCKKLKGCHVTLVGRYELTFAKTPHYIKIYKGNLGGDVPIYFIGHPTFEEREQVYGYEDDWWRFALFGRVITLFPELTGWEPDIVHINDWHVASTAVYNHLAGHRFRMLYTIHNLAYQGVFGPEILPWIEIPYDVYNIDGIMHLDRVNFMKGGIVFSDMTNTVSPKYAEEIQTPEYGETLDGLLKWIASQGRLCGILNGIDYTVYNPETDENLFANYSVDTVAEGKAKNKAELQRFAGLEEKEDAPLFGMVSRLATQKGVDLVVGAIPEIVKRGGQVIILGTGDPNYEEELRNLAKDNPGKVAVFIEFNFKLAQRIYGGCDFFMMPSRFEPCGLGQMIALRYGTIPIVRYTGGLANTVREFDPNTGEGNGFGFVEYSLEEFVKAIERAFEVYRNPGLFAKLRENGMREDFSWARSAREYISTYEKILKGGEKNA